MKPYYFLFIFLFFINVDLHSQSFSFHGGYRPNNLKGTHFSAKVNVYKYKKWTFATSVTFVKYQTFLSGPDRVNGIGLHVEQKGDKTFINFPQLNRGYIIQSMETDFRPMDLNHRFSLFGGYTFVDNSNFLVNMYFGPHISLSRLILDNLTKDRVILIREENGQEEILPYNDYQIYRSWDAGIGTRVEAEYKVFQNVSIGLSSQMFFDVLQEGIDLVVGGGVSYHFNPSK